MAYNLGGMVRLTFAVRDDTLALVNPSTATLTITQPDGTLAAGILVDTTPTVTGQLVYDFAPTQAGLHSVHWATTGPVSGEDDVFTVAAPARMLVSVDEAIEYLNAAGVITADAKRETLQMLSLVATDAIERDLDRVLVRHTFTETYTGSTVIQLRRTPVLSVTSVTSSGVVLAPAAYLLDPVLGLLYYGNTTGYSHWSRGLLNVSVVYVAGYADPPQVARLAALNLIQSMFQQSQQAFHPGIDESGAEVFAQAGLPGLRQIPGYDSLRSMAVA